jgi:hypothetical protein
MTRPDLWLFLLWIFCGLVLAGVVRRRATRKHVRNGPSHPLNQ